MPKFTTSDGIEIFYKDSGAGSQPIVFSHGWPLNADAWDSQMMYFGLRGYRVVAHDRRGFGRSDKTWSGNTNDRFADDIAELIERLDLTNVVLVGHSMGGGDVARYVGRHGTGRLAKIVLLSAVTPTMVQTEANPDGTPMKVFDTMRDSILANRSELMQATAKKFYGFNKLLAVENTATEDAFWLMAMQAGIKATYDCVAQFSEDDFTPDLRKFDVPTLIIHGDADQIVPAKDSAEKAAAIVPHATLTIYSGGSHGIAQVQADKFNDDLAAFIKT